MLLHEVFFVGLRRNSFLKNPFGSSDLMFAFCALGRVFDSKSFFNFSFTCRTIPTSSSSTLRFKPADVSMYLQSYFWATALASESKIQSYKLYDIESSPSLLTSLPLSLGVWLRAHTENSLLIGHFIAFKYKYKNRNRKFKTARLPRHHILVTEMSLSTQSQQPFN